MKNEINWKERRMKKPRSPLMKYFLQHGNDRELKNRLVLNKSPNDPERGEVIYFFGNTSTEPKLFNN